MFIIPRSRPVDALSSFNRENVMTKEEMAIDEYYNPSKEPKPGPSRPKPGLPLVSSDGTCLNYDIVPVSSL